jgi:hypothetical protein
VSVDLARFAHAEPDRWALHGATAIRHLEESHQLELAMLARDNGVPGVTGVSVRAADADSLVLSCLSREGVADVVLPFTPPLDDPRLVVRRLVPGGSGSLLD